MARRPKTDDQLRAVGITCGIGSMLIGARAAGFKIEGNVEWRKYYHEKDAHGQNTFEVNYPGALFPNDRPTMTEEEFQRFSNADIALGHPECGNFSRLSGANPGQREKMFDPADIPLFCELVAEFKPRYFVMDDLPKSFMAFPMAKYHELLPDYDLFPEWVSNWGYGNVQKGRDRMFMLGALRKEKWTFIPGEAVHSLKVKDVIGDLPEPRARGNFPNHDPADGTLDCFRALNLGRYRKKNSWDEVKEYFRDKKGGFTLEYHPSEESKKERAARGDNPMVKRIGFLKGHWDGPAHVLTGGNASVHFHRGEPYTVRERARIQGFPDDFVFYGTVLNDRGEWSHDLNQHMVRQTGKAMPIQFCTYVSKQIMAHIKKEPFETTGERVNQPNEHVDEAKTWYCQNVGYTDQKKACGACWLSRRCAVRVDKYGMKPIAPPPRAARTEDAPRVRTRSPRTPRKIPRGVPQSTEPASVSE
ncbi:MAG: DNA cytosine methyltransferase [Myxococcaceae bacterium]|nr:MAG: DNA cytosine methyltransferase [Myxococcaceae bacterium]